MNWILGNVSSAHKGLVATWLKGLLNPLIPPPALAWLALKNLFGGNRERSDDRFRIVLCWLENDDTGKDTFTVERAFRNVTGVSLVRSARVVKAPGAADVWRPAMLERARTVLAEWNADLAIAGCVNKSESALSLWLIPYEGGGTLERGDRWPYTLGKEVTLGQDFHEDLQAELAALALAAVAPLADNEAKGRLLEQGLWNAVIKLRNLVDAIHN